MGQSKILVQGQLYLIKAKFLQIITDIKRNCSTRASNHNCLRRRLQELALTDDASKAAQEEQSKARTRQGKWPCPDEHRRKIRRKEEWEKWNGA